MTQEAPPYYQAARFLNKTAAGKAYDPIQAIIFEEKCDLSAYRFFEQNQRKWYVVVIGEQPFPITMYQISRSETNQYPSTEKKSWLKGLFMMQIPNWLITNLCKVYSGKAWKLDMG